MVTMTTAGSTNGEVRVSPSRGTGGTLRRLSSFRPRLAHASLLVTSVVAVKSFQMSFAALHQLSVRNLVPPDLASNVPIAIDGLVIASIIATAAFRQWSVGWWYSTALFALSTLVSIAGNIQYAHEIGGSVVPMCLYAGMPLTMLFAVHLTLMLWERGKQVAAEHAAELEASGLEHEIEVSELEDELEDVVGAAEHDEPESAPELYDAAFDWAETGRAKDPYPAAQPRLYPLESAAPGYSLGQTTGVSTQPRPVPLDADERRQFYMTAAQM
ncbi:DUF2637 domain-containing protein [Nocardia sp. CA-145437]|uniref:DUF2637 domain-containing protein n=1 Tax=Nocardia sp. CA-145437 TaxID=3239980 RepID=UPI003D999C2A